MRKKTIILTIAVFLTIAFANNASAFWGKASKIDNKSYERLVKNNMALTEEIENLTKSFEKSKEMYALLLEKVKMLQDEKMALSRTKESVDFMLVARDKTIDDLSGQIAVFDEQLTEARKQLKERDYKLRKQVLSEVKDKHREEIDRLKKDILALKKEYVSLKNENAENDKIIKNIELEKNRQIARENELKKNIAGMEELLEKEKNKTADSEKLAEEAEELKKSLKQKEFTENELENLRGETRQLETDYNNVKRDFSDLKKEYDAKVKNIQSLNAFLTSLKKSSGLLNDEINERGAELKSLNKVVKELQFEKENITKQESKAREEINEREKQLKRKDEQILDQKGAITALKTELEIASGALRQEKSANEKLALEISEFEKNINEAELYRIEAKNYITELEQNLEDAVRENETGEDKIRGINTGLEKLKKENARLEAEIEALKEKVIAEENENKSFQDSLKQEETARKALAAEYSAATSDLNAEKEKNVKLLSAAENLNAKIAEYEKNRAGFLKENRVFESKIALQEKEVNKLRQNLEKAGEAEKSLKLRIDNARDEMKIEKQNLLGRVKTAETALKETRDKFNKQNADFVSRKKRFYSELEQSERSRKALERKTELVQIKFDDLEQKITKERADMHYNLAVVYDERGMYKEAEGEYKQCLKISPKDAGAHYNLGILYDDKLNNAHQAAKHYKKFLELRPMGEDAMRVRNWMFNVEQEKRLGPEVR